MFTTSTPAIMTSSSFWSCKHSSAFECQATYSSEPTPHTTQCLLPGQSITSAACSNGIKRGQMNTCQKEAVIAEARKGRSGGWEGRSAIIALIKASRRSCRRHSVPTYEWSIPTAAQRRLRTAAMVMQLLRVEPSAMATCQKAATAATATATAAIGACAAAHLLLLDKQLQEKAA